MMQLATSIRSTLFFGGLLAITLSIVLDRMFATDSSTIPEPATWSLLAIAGVVAVAGSIIRRRKK
jgi:hypothetical protein